MGEWGRESGRDGKNTENPSRLSILLPWFPALLFHPSLSRSGLYAPLVATIPSRSEDTTRPKDRKVIPDPIDDREFQE